MRHPIDVVFCSSDGVVRHVVRGMRPRRITRVVPSAGLTLELAGGSLPPSVEPGSVLRGL